MLLYAHFQTNIKYNERIRDIRRRIEYAYNIQ